MNKQRCTILGWVYASTYNFSSTYHKKKAAILTGIVAFLNSTKSWFSVVCSYFLSIRFQSIALIFRLIIAFLFCSKVDKPCFSPGCRSPPFLSFLKNEERRDSGVSNIRGLHHQNANQRNEQRRHMVNGDIYGLQASGKVTTDTLVDGEKAITRYVIDAVLEKIKKYFFLVGGTFG